MSRGDLCILSVPVQVGKTTRLQAWVAEAQSKGQRFGGFLMPDNAVGQRMLQPLSLGAFAQPIEDPVAGDLSIGRFRFRTAAFQAALAALDAALEETADWVVVDEIGPLEIRKAQGLEPGFGPWIHRWRQQMDRPNLLLVIRDFLLEEATKTYDLQGAKVNEGPWFAPDLAPIAGVLLAGGESKRRAKPNLPHPAGGTWNSQAHDQLARHLPNVWISGGMADAAQWAGHGPLTGILSAADALPGHSLLVRSVDRPDLSDTAIAKLLSAHRLTGRSVCFRQGERLEPLVALYSARDLDWIRKNLETSGQDALPHMLDPLVLPVHARESLGLTRRSAAV